MVQIIIEGVYAITDETQDLFFDLWDEDHADPVKIEQLITNGHQQFVRLDNPKAPYCPNPKQKPNEELWLWAEPSDPDNFEKMVALKMHVETKPFGEFDETPSKWTLGKSSLTMIIYKKTCCPEYSVMLCGEFEDGWDFRIRDSQRTHDRQKQIFADKVEHDKNGIELAHEYDHVKSGDRACHHSHKPK